MPLLKRQEPAGLTPTSGTPFDVLSVDFKGPLETGDYALLSFAPSVNG